MVGVKSLVGVALVVSLCLYFLGLDIWGVMHKSKPSGDLDSGMKATQPNEVCNGSSLLTFNKNIPYLCYEHGDKHPRIMNGFSIEQVLVFMREREENAWKQMFDEVDRSESHALAQVRLENARKEYGQSPRVSDIVAVSVTKTLDSGEYVIGLSAASGQRYSLWLYSGAENAELRVRTVTPY